MTANIPASIHRKLLNVSREQKRPFEEILQYFTMERFLFRLSQTKHRDRFVLKGALLMQVWAPEIARATKDIDFLGKGENSPENLAKVIKECCEVEIIEDGLKFNPESILAEKIKEGEEYEGIRISFRASLGKAKIAMQIDVGFGDAVFPAPKVEQYRSLLDFEGAKLACYPRETVIAEKFQAMVQLGIINSRMKDFYDIWYLSQNFKFEGEVLMRAVKGTFSRRETEIDLNAVALTREFSADATKQAQWKGFLRKTRLGTVPPDLKEVVEAIGHFLIPVAKTAKGGQLFKEKWDPRGPWK